MSALFSSLLINSLGQLTHNWCSSGWNRGKKGCGYYRITVPLIIERRQKDWGEEGGGVLTVFSAFISTAIIWVNNYPKCKCWLQIPPVACCGTEVFAHQIWMKWMLMCSIMVPNHGHQWAVRASGMFTWYCKIPGRQIRPACWRL